MKEKLNLKIYGLTKVGAKGQIIIPKDCREDFTIKTGEDFAIVMVDKKAFGIGRDNNNDYDEDMCEGTSELEDFGHIQVGTKYQFVIPNDIRVQLGIKPTDNLLVVGEQSGKKEGLGFIKNDNVEYLLDFIKNYANNYKL